MKQNIIREAIADAQVVQQAAEERARAMLMEAFTPKIKSALANVINEEVSTNSDQPGGYNPETDRDALGAGAPGQSADELSDKGDGPEKIQEEDDLPIDDKDDEDEPVVEAEEDEADPLDPLDKDSDDQDVLEIVDDDEMDIDDEPADDSEIPPSVDEIEDEEPLDAKDDDDVNALTEAKKKNKALVQENYQLKGAITELQNKFKKVDLFNAKLAYAFKLMTQPGLTRVQKKQIAETFDAAKTVREAQLIYKTFKKQVQPIAAKQPLKNKNIRAVISESTKPDNTYSRMNELAGI